MVDRYYDKRRVDFSEATFSRASSAYDPETGRRVANDVPRINRQRIPILNWEPRTFYSFPVLTETTYDATGDADNNLVDRKTTFETEFPEFVKVNLGSSFQGRPIDAYRLGPLGRKHFVITNVVHGNEHDGILGSFKAMEILAREPEFQPFRDEWTLFFIPCMNPDGYFANTRLLANIGPNGNPVNLNRNWNWFWDEYVESSSESKGSSVESEVETMALLNYWRGTGPFAGQGAQTFSFLVDAHADQGVGARYQSRDRIWRGITNTPSEFPKDLTNLIPNSYLTVYIDFYTWRTASALMAKRVKEEGGPDRGIRYFRSRFRPHLHSYFSSQGITSIAFEETKVAAAGGRETYQSAANYRMDYLIAIAACITSDNWVMEDACLIENAASNMLSNAEWEQWQPGDERPGHFTHSRSTITRNTNIPEFRENSERHFEDGGEAITLTSDTDVEMDDAAEFVKPANIGAGKYAAFNPTANRVFVFNTDASFRSGYAGDPTVDPAHAPEVGYGAAYALDDALDIIGGGTAAPATGASTEITRMESLFTDTPVSSNPGTLNTARMFHAVADNYVDSPLAANVRAYIFGGFDGGGSRLNTAEIWNPDTATSTNSGNTLPLAIAEAEAVYYPTTNKIFVFGGSSGADAAVSTIYEYSVTLDTFSTHATSMTVALKNVAASYHSIDGKIYIFGGEKIDGTMSDKVYSFDPSTGVYQEETISQNLDDDEDAHDHEGSPWVVPIGRWGAVLLDDPGDASSIVMVGGRLTDGSGSILETVYTFDVEDMSISLERLSEYGYVRYSVPVVDTSYSALHTDDFSGALALWSDPSTAWIDGGGYAEGAIGLSGPLISTFTPTHPMFSLSVDTSLKSTGTLPDFGIVGRATYTGATLDDGYRVRYSHDGVNHVWYLERIVSGVATVLDTLDVTADASRQVTAVAKSLVFLVEDKNPVWLRATIDGNSVFSHYDFSSDRITTTGKMALFGGGA